MRKRQVALTGPAAAARYGLDGYRDLLWPVQWCTPHTNDSCPGALRTRWWDDPVWVDDIPLAPLRVVLRHLGLFDVPQADGVSLAHRVELAIEHALRDGGIVLTDLTALGGTNAGDRLLRHILRQRGDEPAAESHAETRAIQRLRDELQWRTWRQFDIVGESGKKRVDLVIPFLQQRRRRPEQLVPDDGLLVEIDSEEFHAPAFERDSDRDNHYDSLGYHWVSIRPTLVEHNLAKVSRIIDGAMSRHRPHSALSPPTPRRKRPETDA